MTENPPQNQLTLNNSTYRWSVVSSDVVTDVFISHTDGRGQILRVGFDYNTDATEKSPPKEITPSLIQKIILFALKKGWEPTESGLVDFVIYGEEIDP